MDARKSDLELETVISRISSGKLDLQPDFQRGEVWDLPRRQRLVDTILRDWYVPAIHVVREADGTESVLDGQQRLVTIRDFVRNDFPVNGATDPEDPVVRDLDGLRFDELPPSRQSDFLHFVLPVVTLTNFRPQEPNELFFRLNQSYNLTPSEKRNALHGETRDQVRQVLNDLIEMGLLKREVIGFSNSRLGYDDIVSRVCVALEMGTLRQHINNSVVERFYRTSPFRHETIVGVRRAGELLLNQIMQAGGHTKFNKGTLQTWLVYCYWAPQTTGPLPDGLFARFEDDRALIRRGQESRFASNSRTLDVLALYNDRASYRVTDVSSVVIRDLAIHLFSESEFETKSYRRSGEFLAELESKQSTPVVALVDRYQEACRWGEPLVAGGHAS